ncbi:MAG: hypothetical protein MI919_02660 [Holophagales bacterium]|nr:hypothetical protein [Holophagales bacterium]
MKSPSPLRLPLAPAPVLPGQAHPCPLGHIPIRHRQPSGRRPRPGPALAFLALWIPLLLTPGIAWAQEDQPAPPAAEGDGQEGEGQLSEDQERNAKDAFVLLTSNQKRVLGLGYDTSYSRGTSSSSRDSSSPVTTGVSSTRLRKAETAKAKKSLEITEELLDDLGETVVTPQLGQMQRLQKRLVGRIGRSSSGEVSAADLSLEFAIAEREVEQLLPVSEQERSAILQRYWSRLTDLDGFGTLSSSSLDPEDLDTPPMTVAEYRKKQERYQEWLKEQRRKKQDERREHDLRRQRQREREEARQERLAEPREQPKAGIDRQALERILEAEKGVDRGPTDEAQAAMETWYTFWTRKSLPLKNSLKVFLPMRLDRRTEALIRACQNLYQTSAALGLDDILNAPDPEVATGLRQAVKAFESAGQHCMYGRAELAENEVEAARSSLRQAVARLRYYSLEL